MSLVFSCVFLHRDPQFSHEREMVRGNKRRPPPLDVELYNFNMSGIIQMIKMQKRQDAGIGSLPLQMSYKVEALHRLFSNSVAGP